MPSSRHYTISLVLDKVMKIKPKTILDIGIGYGKYGVLFREYLDLWNTDESFDSVNITGVEAFKKYQNPVWDVYDSVYLDDIKNVLPLLRKKPVFDLVFMGDVIEHFTKEEGLRILKELVYNNIIIVTPLEVSEQTIVYGNEYETHKSSWSKEDLPDLNLEIIRNQQVFYG